MGNYSSILTEMVARLTYHADAAASGRLLTGWKFVDVPEQAIDSEADVPILRMFVPEITEKFMAASTPEGSLRIKLTVGTKRVDGLPGLMAGVEKVLDAIETKTNGDIDPLLAGTIADPFDVSSENGFSESVTSTAQLVLTMKPAKVTQRGKRHL